MGLNPHARRPLPCLRYVPAVVVNLQLPRSWDRTNCAKVVLFRAVMAKNSIEILRSSSKPISWMVVYYQAQKIFKPCLTPLVTVYGHHPKVFIMSKNPNRAASLRLRRWNYYKCTQSNLFVNTSMKIFLRLLFQYALKVLYLAKCQCKTAISR